MISRENACACLEAASTPLKELSYQELERFAESRCMLDNWKSQQLQVDGEDVYVNTMIARLGRIHKRISVELTLSAERGILPLDTPCVYFERFASGRFFPSPREQTREAALLKSLPYALLGGIVIGLLALVWYLFLPS